MARRNRNKDQARRELFLETKKLHTMAFENAKHDCDENKLGECVAFQMLIPQAAENIRRRDLAK